MEIRTLKDERRANSKKKDAGRFEMKVRTLLTIHRIRSFLGR